MFNKVLKPILERLPESNRYERIWKLAQIDFKKRYYNDKLGLFWALINPLLRVAIYYLIFSIMLPKVSERIPNYALYLFLGLILWLSFTEMSRKGIRLLYKKKYLIENIEFDKVDLYYSNSLSVTFGLFFNILVFIAISLLTGVSWGLSILWLPVLFLTLFFIGTGFSMIVSVIYIYLKDIDHVLDIVFLLGIWTSGIFFAKEDVVREFPWYEYVNPFLGLIDNFRNVLIYHTEVDLVLLSVNLLMGLVLFLIGLFLLDKYSHKAMEYI